MTFTKGGRGKKAPYETTHIRIPRPLKPLIDKLISKYRELVEQGQATEGLLDSLASSLDDQKPVNKLSDCHLSKQEAIELAEKLYNQKKSKKETITKLLTSIYGGDIDLKM